MGERNNWKEITRKDNAVEDRRCSGAFISLRPLRLSISVLCLFSRRCFFLAYLFSFFFLSYYSTPLLTCSLSRSSASIVSLSLPSTLAPLSSLFFPDLASASIPSHLPTFIATLPSSPPPPLTLPEHRLPNGMLETPGAASARVRQHLRAPSFAYKKLWAVILQLAAYLAALCLRRITDTIRLYHLIATRVTHWTPTPLRRLAVRITAPVGHVGMRVVACTRRGRDALAAMARAENADSLDPRTAPLPAASDVTTTDLTPPRPAPPRVDGISPRTYAAAETLAPPEGRRSRSRSPSPGLRSRSPSPSTRRRALPTLLQRQVLQTRGGVPVEVLRTRLSSSALRPSRVIVVVPGNPGLPEFYSEFLLALRASTGAHCLALGHTGHSIGTARRKPLALDAQIDLKRQALEQLRKTWSAISSWVIVALSCLSLLSHIDGL